MGILNGSTGRFFNASAQSQNLQGVWVHTISPNLPIRSKINVNKESWYTPHLKDDLILIIFYWNTWVV